jgi:signal transduction histidine kinase
MGIPKDKRESIFAPFTQADNSSTKKFGGTGLGLTMAARLAATIVDHSGWTAKSGTEVTFTSQYK